jgi:hypothetical protein
MHRLGEESALAFAERFEPLALRSLQPRGPFVESCLHEFGDGAGGFAVPVLYLHHGFLSFLADWAYRVREIIREFDDRGRPTPAASTT